MPFCTTNACSRQQTGTLLESEIHLTGSRGWKSSSPPRHLRAGFRRHQCRKERLPEETSTCSSVGALQSTGRAMRARLRKLLSSLLVGCPDRRLAASAPDCCFFVAAFAARDDTGSQPAGQSRTSQAKRSASDVSESRRSKARPSGAKRSPASQTKPRDWVGCRGCKLAGCVPEPFLDCSPRTDRQQASSRQATRSRGTPAERSLAKPSKARRRQAKPSEAQRRQAKPTEAKRRQARPSGAS